MILSRSKMIAPVILAIAISMSLPNTADALSKRAKNTMGGAAIGTGVGYIVGGSNGAAAGAVVGAIAGYTKKK